jgi:hypothetical protein
MKLPLKGPAKQKDRQRSSSRDLTPMIFAQSIDPSDTKNGKSFEKSTMSDKQYKTTMNEHLQRIAEFENRFNTNNVISDPLATPKVNPLSLEGSS